RSVSMMTTPFAYRNLKFGDETSSTIVVTDDDATAYQQGQGNPRGGPRADRSVTAPPARGATSALR
ncbi:hypothetical protein, partial [Bacillus cereus]|uniref:hypothetical protein n=1 Tax=Bacillus cereus TaxID=1396 RepID=UPI0036660310